MPFCRCFSITSSLDDIDEEPFRVQVEAERKGILSKGSIVIQNNSVIETKLNPIQELLLLEVTMRITGMTCAACVAAVEKSLYQFCGANG